MSFGVYDALKECRIYDSREVEALRTDLAAERARAERANSMLALAQSAMLEQAAATQRAMAERDRLRELVFMMQERAKEGLRAWDKDQDAKAGKCLKALAGLSPGYWPEMDELRAALGAK